MSDITVGGRRLPLPAGRVRRIVAAVLAGERRTGSISITFVGRDTMRRMNATYLGHDRPTDVISFGMTEPGGDVVGDIYVCPWVARREAANRGIGVREELVRLVIHGVLHAVGHDHPEGDDRARSPMWRRQERYVEALA